MLGTILLSLILLTDTLVVDKAQNLDEVVITSATGRSQKRSVKGQVASIDEHLAQLHNVNLVRRGSYAWEPVVNNMQMERLSTTIDGMKIFYACTDKMDPVTSYVESGNLQRISLNSGLDGNPQATGNIGGALDLRLRKAGFDNTPRLLNLSAGHEWNGHVQVYGADAALSGHRLYANVGAFYRHAGNYRTGGGDELQFSQFQKVNAFANAGARLAERDIVEATIIFDRATDVGYPALNMDVSKAEAVITSLSYRHQYAEHPLLNSWETKVYYNHITHEMDDTKRPDTYILQPEGRSVARIHMDMPGRSWTAGLYSLLTGTLRQHDVQLNYDLYYNRLFADMTMYLGSAAPMYMVTWPDVGTLNTGLALSDQVRLSTHQSLRLSAKVAWQQQRLNSDEGYHALQVFFPTMTNSYHQTTARMAASYALEFSQYEWTVGAGWGSRAPTVTESYGYYLNNTFDLYDYMGNPSLKNESAIELNTSLKCSARNGQWSMSVDGNVFLFSNYIIGQQESRLSPMTIGAAGVKVYGNIQHATIANLSLTTRWQPLRQLGTDLTLGYALGRDADDDPLPLISPFSYAAHFNYTSGALNLQAELRGNARQTHYAPKYGEQPTPAYAIVNVSAEYQYRNIVLRAGVENLLDRCYATYADWNQIPQKGRNIYANLTFQL